MKSFSLAAALALVCGAAAAAPLTVSSTSFAENGPIAALQAGNTGNCGGKGISPQLAWANLPAGAKSVAILALDPDGAKGLGVSHWVAYNIDAGRGQLKQGEGTVDGGGVTVGKNVAGLSAYRGMCPPSGDAPHHYIFSVIASDLAPGALPPGLNREELLAALKGHALGGQSTLGTYAR
ncbi:MAG TPA: YbhB/YbcL family Raf kinase inhibitor-like protein [Janthinobacterium sp.]|nr:YbhB/YbcL family Raf kinase inhibitor-like protein [Janthinobacterium sp.]